MIATYSTFAIENSTFQAEIGLFQHRLFQGAPVEQTKFSPAMVQYPLPMQVRKDQKGPYSQFYECKV
jgi:hypothetical protein